MTDGTQVSVRARWIRAPSSLEPVAVALRAIVSAAGPGRWRLFL